MNYKGEKTLDYQQASLDKERVFWDIGQHLPDIYREDLPPNHLLQILRRADSVSVWLNPSAPLFRYLFDGKYEDISYSLGLSVVTSGQPNDQFVRSIDRPRNADGSVVQGREFARVHGMLRVAGSKPFRFRYGMQVPEEGITQVRNPHTGFVITDYFSFNPAGWGDNLDRGYVAKRLPDGSWWCAFDDYVYRNPVAVMDDRYARHGIRVKESAVDIEVRPNLQSDALGNFQFPNIPVFGRRGQTASGILLPRSISFANSLINL